ncbi:cytochrome c oxidase assembly protein COX16 homolog, mitochondrial [Anthonomus grandis grandis]|uniref:cytochrome c oxidase assembly protein COX16 homolog, mitochondrial n=1 Tax=Anthonomus grandis grandis TaxID=2921223 RepID=UPI002165282B|nr:cytochrome c oxidase assembly protein COX16 homolog, mitochondrial [Anthonomus grandis grandis]
MGLMSNASSTLDRFFKRKFVRFGLPFLILMVGSSFGLKEFTKLRYEFKKVSPVSHEEAKKMGVEMKKPGEVTLEGEYEKLKSMDIDNWEQVRGPRPWEETAEK